MPADRRATIVTAVLGMVVLGLWIVTAYAVLQTEPSLPDLFGRIVAPFVKVEGAGGKFRRGPWG